jgi:hypothetical protein
MFRRSDLMGRIPSKTPPKTGPRGRPETTSTSIEPAPNAVFLAATKTSSAMDRWSGSTANARHRIDEFWMMATAQKGSH